MIRVAIAPTFDAFRDAARPLLAAGTLPEEILWEDAASGQAVLFGAPAPLPAPPPRAGDTPGPRISARAVDLARVASFHRDPERFSVLYRVLYRLTHGEPELLEIASDPDTLRLRGMVQAVRRDEHKMHAFVRFRRVDIPGDDTPWYVAWYAPDHTIVRLGAPFFERRFASMRWSILTPDESAYWDGHALAYGPGVPRSEAPREDAYEEMFRTYYRAIFNPARVNLTAMRTEMPKKFWADMPETRVLNELVRDSALRVEQMKGPAASASSLYLPRERTLPVLREAIRGCRACGLCEHATQAVFGEGADASGPAPRVMLVGEQPGDAEDLSGRPFVGPAGQLLDDALAQAGINRGALYVTNAVKHFKFTPRGKRRLHQRPVYDEVQACRAWLDAEIEAVRPKVIVALGGTAGTSFYGKRFQVTKRRGRVETSPWAPAWIATWHPSAVLRAGVPAGGQAMFNELVSDLALARGAAEAASDPPRGT